MTLLEKLKKKRVLRKVVNWFAIVELRHGKRLQTSLFWAFLQINRQFQSWVKRVQSDVWERDYS